MILRNVVWPQTSKNANTSWYGNVSILRYIHLSLYVASDERFRVENLLVSIELIYSGSTLISCGLLWFRMPGSCSPTRKEGYMRNPRSFVPPTWIWNCRRVVPCNRLHSELHKQGEYRYASYPWRTLQKFCWGQAVVRWKVPQLPDTQSWFQTPVLN